MDREDTMTWRVLGPRDSDIGGRAVDVEQIPRTILSRLDALPNAPKLARGLATDLLRVAEVFEELMNRLRQALEQADNDHTGTEGER